jgi:hypothetical protein
LRALLADYLYRARLETPQVVIDPARKGITLMTVLTFFTFFTFFRFPGLR